MFLQIWHHSQYIRNVQMDGLRGNESYLDILNNFILPQLQNFFHSQVENGIFQRL